MGAPEHSSGGQEPGTELAEQMCAALYQVPVSARGNVSTAKLTWPCAVCPTKTSWCAHGGGMGSGVTRMAKPSATSPKRKKGMLQPRYVDVHFGQC